MMDFRNANKFNLVVNALSANYFPLTPEKVSLNIGFKLWAMITWSVQLLFIGTVMIGAFCVPPLRAFEKSAVPSMAVVEIIIGTIYLNSRRGHLRTLIRLFNEILVDSDVLRKYLNETVEPHKRSLKIYTIMTASSTAVWALSPLLLLLMTDQFSYDDFIEPAYLPGEPFTPNVFIAGVFLQLLGNCFVLAKKVHIDIYVSYFVTILTAEYKYIREQIAAALHRDPDADGDQKAEEDVIIALRKCVEHHCIVIKAGQMLVDLMAVQVGVTYINSILRFCFLGFSFITFADNILSKCIYITFGAGTLIQVYMLCSCVQDLLEASASITDDAFHEDWHGQGKTITKILSTIELSNQMECRLTAYRIVDLTTPTLASILNKAYSICLFLLNMK